MTLKYMPYFVDEETGSQSRIIFSTRITQPARGRVGARIRTPVCLSCTVWILGKRCCRWLKFPNGWESPGNGLQEKLAPLTPPRLLKASKPPESTVDLTLLTHSGAQSCLLAAQYSGPPG